MSNPIETVKKYNQAFEAKDVEAMRSLLNKNYHFKGPMTEMHGSDEMLGFMANCPFACSQQNLAFVAEGNKVVQTFDWVTIAPFKATVSMCEVLEVQDGQIKSAKLFYDSAAFPKEAQEMMQQMMQNAA
ncbi:MAG: nuclear transport factor 2 family protein [Alphaproteobacteria bacterium]|nr:nuclear transport factor 2 family protein [Alphaproteobacteria bacterium]